MSLNLAKDNQGNVGLHGKVSSIFGVQEVITFLVFVLKSSKCTTISSWHFREKLCIGLFLGISSRIHKKSILNFLTLKILM
jgi:hypothetical protein